MTLRDFYVKICVIKELFNSALKLAVCHTFDVFSSITKK